MSFLSKLSQLKKRSTTEGQSRLNDSSTTSHANPNLESYTLLPKNYVREDDPAIKRLKELRRQELLKNGQLSKKSKEHSRTRLPSKRKNDKNDDPDRPSPASASNFKRKIGAHNIHKKAIQLKKSPEPLKKISFEELMKQAENNAKKDQNSSRSSPTASSHEFAQPGFKPRSKHHKPFSSKTLPTLKTHRPTVTESKETIVKLPKMGFAKPNEKFKKALESRKKPQAYEYDESDEELEDFIEDDKEEVAYPNASKGYGNYPETTGYDRDEIWAMFNKGRKRSDYAFNDYEDDDMEANEMEILEEEEKAGKLARLEDKREEEWLKNHEKAKKHRQIGRNSR